MNSQAPAAPRPLEGPTLALASIALAIGTFMQVLDATIANVSIPTIAGDLGVAVDQGTWVITGFAVANGISVPLTGWLMQRFGVVRTFVGSVALFTIMSFLCGIAWNLESLVFFRILQGAVSGPMIPGSQALLIMIFGRQRQATALAIWSMTTLVAPICGPILGGYISDNFSWPWIFLINLPVGIACSLICWTLLRSRETPTRRLPVDTIGFSMLVVWVGALQIMLDTGKDADWFSSPAIVVEAIVSAVAFIAWVIWEMNDRHPIVDLSLFRSRNFALGTLAFCLGYAAFFGINLLMPLWLQTQMGYPATWAGLTAAPSGVVAVFLTPFIARLISRIDARWIATMSLAAFGLSFWMRGQYGPDADFTELVMPVVVMGIGMSGFFISMVTICLNGVPAEQVPQASGLTNFARITAGSFAASLVTTWWANSEALHQTRLAEIAGSRGNPVWNHALEALQHHGASLQQAIAVLGNQVGHQAVLLATMDIFTVAGVLTAALIGLVWLTSSARSQGGHAAASE
ncbi:MAG TPA: DHA2 family efflux MFS transporter permease subunit [Vitreimonas sp.]|nr:DHA2 family efflux MFS transporter permease subunit [Vitreimonas sp.]